jgi:hypothetical protein
VVAIATQLPTASYGTLSIVLDGTNSFSADYNSQDPVEYIQGELLSLSLRHAEVQKRIQHLRHALLALVHVFGPEILATAARDSKVHSRQLSRRAPKIIDISRQVLSRSSGWLTFNQVFEAIREECPSALSGFINPGVSVSNALRTLQRYGEIEFSSDDAQGRLRWLLDKKVPAETSQSSVS